MDINFNSIGLIHSPFTSPHGMPIQPCGARGVKGHIILNQDLVSALTDLDGFSHIWLIYVFHRCEKRELTVSPYLDPGKHGVFATRAPCRPNGVGLSRVRLTGIHSNRLDIEDVDVLDGTPLLDLKPVVPAFDLEPVQRWGWLQERDQQARQQQADDRFHSADPPAGKASL